MFAPQHFAEDRLEEKGIRTLRRTTKNHTGPRSNPAHAHTNLHMQLINHQPAEQRA